MIDLTYELQLLKRTRDVFKKLEKANREIPNVSFLEGKRADLFNSIKEKLENYIWKTENNILEVAFVGLEKAGKSTFANAFIGRELLPSQRDRATYIPTEVRYSPEGKVEVYFYSKERFLKVFRSMLRDVNYPKWKEVTLETISVEDFKKHFRSLEKENKALYEKHKNKLERDILEILERKDEIEKLLTGDKEVFKEDEVENYKQYIVDPHLSRAVERVVIYSSKLQGLENVVIYDLPGFDSPTFTHISYTIDFLKKADAIVFVREADKPSLKGPEVDILSKTKENDGVPIKEKLFFFLTKVDVLETPEEVEEIKRKFIADLKRHDLFLDESRIFLGSAKAHFEKNKKDSSPRWQKLKSLGLSDDGIDRIKKSLIEYNQKVRRKLLKIRINRFIESSIKPFLEDVREDIHYYENNVDAIAVSIEEVKKIYFRLQEKLPSQLEALINQIKQEIENDKPITSELRNKIPVNIEYPDEEIINRLINQIKSEDYTVGNLMPSAFNKAVRNYLKKKIRENFTKMVLTSVEKKIQQAEETFINLILEHFEDVAEINDIQSFRRAFKDFLREELKTYSFEQSGLKALVERFSGDLIDLTMIPLTDVDREEKFKVALRDFISLAAYDEGFDLSKPLIEHPLIFKLLTHQDAKTIFSEVEDIVQKVKAEIGDIIFDFIPYGKLVQIIWKLHNEGLKTVDILNKIEELITNFNKRKKESSDTKQEENQNVVFTLINQIRESLSQPRTYDEVDTEIRTDLEILKELLGSVVLRAIHAERAYSVAIVNYGNNLKGLITSEKFFDFIKNHRHLLLGSRYQKLEEWQKYKPILEELKLNLDNLLRIL